MCLKINRARKAPKSPIRVYKVYATKAKNLVASLCQGARYDYKSGKTIISSRSSAALTECTYVYEGFHAFTRKRDAICEFNDTRKYGNDVMLIELEAQPEDFVTFGYNPDVSSGVVFTKLKFKRIIKGQWPGFKKSCNKRKK